MGNGAAEGESSGRSPACLPPLSLASTGEEGRGRSSGGPAAPAAPRCPVHLAQALGVVGDGNEQNLMFMEPREDRPQDAALLRLLRVCHRGVGP